MNKLVSIIIAVLVGWILCSTESYGQKNIPTTDVLVNTFLIKTDTLSGTCFLIQVSDEEFLVTAKHLFRKHITDSSEVSFGLVRDSVLEKYSGVIYLHANNKVDVVVIKTSRDIGYLKPYESYVDGYILGQECYFLGFPYSQAYGTKWKFGRAPMVKKAIISAGFKDGKVDLLLLDGHNNPGFSGGPVIAYDNRTEQNKILGVVSAYISQTNEGNLKAGSVVLPFDYHENSGIIVTYPAKYFLETIDRITK